MPAVKTEASPVPSTIAQGVPPPANGQDSNNKRPQSSEAVPVPGADKAAATRRVTRAAAKAAAAATAIDGDSTAPDTKPPPAGAAYVATAAEPRRDPWEPHRGSMSEEDAVLFPVSSLRTYTAIQIAPPPPPPPSHLSCLMVNLSPGCLTTSCTQA